MDWMDWADRSIDRSINCLNDIGWMNGWMGWDGMGWDGMGWDGMGWDLIHSFIHSFLPCFIHWLLGWLDASLLDCLVA